MSREKMSGCVLACLVIGTMAVAAYLQGGMGGLNGYVLGALFAGQWAWVLKGVK